MTSGALRAANLLSSLLGEGFAVAAAPPDPEAEASLYLEERSSILRAGSSRRVEFATARSCARRAMSRLAVTPGPIPVGVAGAPQWPAGIVGSLSHTEGFCLAAVTRRSRALAVGVDAEPDTPLDRDLEALVCTPGERAWIDAMEPVARGRCGKLVFSAKEAFYKAQYVLTGLFLDFPDVELAFDLVRETFRVAAAPRVAEAVPLHQVQGRFGRVEDWLLTTVVIGSAPQILANQAHAEDSGRSGPEDPLP